MVIQRIQTLYLLIATVLIAIFCCTSFGTYQMEEEILSMYPKDFPVFMIVGIVIGVLLFLAIFMFKNLRRQKTVTLVSMMLIVACGATGCFILYGQQGGAQLEWCGGVTLLVGALVFAMLAYRGMNHDQKLLRESDRIR